MSIQCQFSNPLTFDNNTPSSKQDIWNYSQVDCFTTSTIENSDLYQAIGFQYPDKQVLFYLNKSLGVGDIVLIVIVSAAACLILSDIILSLFFGRKVFIKKKEVQ